jgi:sterol desaturase/sphingolipid hydroxylase (fatty acid hydroxylase superfamily)
MHSRDFLRNSMKYCFRYTSPYFIDLDAFIEKVFVKYFYFFDFSDSELLQKRVPKRARFLNTVSSASPANSCFFILLLLLLTLQYHCNVSHRSPSVARIVSCFWQLFLGIYFFDFSDSELLQKRVPKRVRFLNTVSSASPANSCFFILLLLLLTLQYHCNVSRRSPSVLRIVSCFGAFSGVIYSHLFSSYD